MTEEETGLEGAVADDADAEYVRGVCERDIVGAGAALARYLPLLRYLLANPARASHALQAAAALTFTRYTYVITLFSVASLYVNVGTHQRQASKYIDRRIIRLIRPKS